jgi:hypothetical protein
MKLTKRELFLIFLAVRYMQGNREDANDAFRDEEEPEIVKVHGGNLAGTDAGEAEVEALVEKLEKVAEKTA